MEMQRRRRSAFSLALLVFAAVLVALPAAGWSAYPVNAPPFYTQPYLVSPEPHNSMFICWLTSEKTIESYVEFGLDEGYGRMAPAKTYEIKEFKTTDSSGAYNTALPVYQQIVHLKGLRPGTRYHYRSVSDGVATMGYDFKTAPKPGRPFKFVLLSDLQMKLQIPDTVFLAGQQGADLIIYNGDINSRKPERVGEWFDVPGFTRPSDVAVSSTDELSTHRWFNVMQQVGDGCRLLQYVPIYLCPGNHEIDNQTLLTTPVQDGRQQMTMKLYMQLFRPLYPDQQYGADGRHWYSADYGDLHIVSLSINRWFGYAKETSPGWYLFDGIGKSTPQYEWLKKDLRTAQNHKYIWVTQHWHMFNIAAETDVPYTNPVLDASGKVAYDPAKDYLMRDIKPLFEKYGVDAVSFGHSHVYERFLVNGVNYIEAANIGNSYFNFNLDPSLYYSGNGTVGQYIPENVANIKDQNSNRSFLVVSVDKEDGMTAQGIFASGPNTGDVFDLFTVAPSIWK